MSQDIRKILAKNVEKMRREKSLKREELSLILGLDNSYISKLEKARLNVTINKIQLLADFFQIKAEELFK